MDEWEIVVQVNVDVVFLLNFLTDLLWLLGTAALAGVRPRRWQLAAAAAAGAAAAVFAYFPGGRFLAAMPWAALGTLALLALAFFPLRLRQGVRVAGYFLFTGGAMAGVVLLMGARGGPAGWPGAGGWQAPDHLVAAGLLLGLIGARYLWEAARERTRVSQGVYRLRVEWQHEVAEVDALLDTGNDLREPLTGSPVAVVEAAALSHVLPRGLAPAAGQGGEWAAVSALPGAVAARCRMIPYHAVGTAGGRMLAFVPDGLYVRPPGGRSWERVRGLVGLAPRPLTADGAYRAILPPRLVEGMEMSITWEGESR